jgi:hypothetical protein
MNRLRDERPMAEIRYLPNCHGSPPGQAGLADRPPSHLENPMAPERLTPARSCWLWTAAIWLWAGLVAGPALAADPPIDFAHDILPILRDHCAQCHSGTDPKGGIAFDSRQTLLDASLLIPGDVPQSEIIARVTSADPDVRMPPEGDPLAEAQIERLRRWVRQGAPWEADIPLMGETARPLALRIPKLPAPVSGREHPIDRLVDQYLASHQAGFPPAADDATFLRRVSLDLVGLLPTVEQQQEFLDDPDPDRRIKWIRKLLADDRNYAEHWLSFWNDLLRNDYAGTGYIDGGRKQITPWLYQALLENRPYDQMVRELIAPSSESEGFILGIKWRGRVNASQVPEIQFAQNIGQVLLGINLKCASCHDSFVDSWKLADTYGLAAVVADRPLELHRCDKPTGEFAEVRFLFPELGTIDPQADRRGRLQQLAQLMTLPENGRLARTIANRLWHRMMGKGLVEPVDVMARPAWSEELLDLVALHLISSGYDLRAVLELIATSQIYQAQSVVSQTGSEAEVGVFRGPVARRMTAEQFMDAAWSICGGWPENPDGEFGDRDGARVRASLVRSDRLMRVLGRPNREQVVTTRPVVVSTLEALELSNGDELTELIEQGAQRLLAARPAPTSVELVDRLYRQMFGRLPDEDERQLALQVVGDTPQRDAVADLLWILMMKPEFHLVR